MNVKKILGDFYADLRERKLLPVIAGLLVALVAVPILLGGDEAPSPAQANSAGSAALNDGASATSQLEPVVLAAAPGLRKYQERLDSFRSRNPFRQQYAPQEETPLQDDTGSTPADSGSATAAPTTGSATPDSGTDTGTDSGGDSTGDGSGKTKTKRYSLYYQIDVKVGALGGGEKLEAVELLDYLPGKKTPVVQFIGVTEDLTQAVFAVSSGASNVDGEGKCVPSKAACEFLTLSVGQGHRFAYGPDDKNFRIKLTDITEVKVRSRGGAGASAIAG